MALRFGMTTSSLITGALLGAQSALAALIQSSSTVPALARIIDAVSAAISANHKVLICGNGGSLCDAAHFAEELTGRFRNDRRPYAAIACTDAGHITCTANDYAFEHVFARWVTALGQRGDVLIVLSTSGNSANCLNAAAAAKAAGVTTVALLGKYGGQLRGACDLELIVPGETSDRIQELHMLLLHTVVEGLEARCG